MLIFQKNPDGQLSKVMLSDGQMTGNRWKMAKQCRTMAINGGLRSVFRNGRKIGRIVEFLSAYVRPCTPLKRLIIMRQYC
jgi:hypothetical protein